MFNIKLILFLINLITNLITTWTLVSNLLHHRAINLFPYDFGHPACITMLQRSPLLFDHFDWYTKNFILLIANRHCDHACNESANAMECLDRVRCVYAGVDCHRFVLLAKPWATYTMVLHMLRFVLNNFFLSICSYVYSETNVRCAHKSNKSYTNWIQMVMSVLHD